MVKRALLCTDSNETVFLIVYEFTVLLETSLEWIDKKCLNEIRCAGRVADHQAGRRHRFQKHIPTRPIHSSSWTKPALISFLSAQLRERRLQAK